MTLIKIFVFTFSTSFTLFGYLDASIDENFKFEQYLGIWYQVGLILPGTSENRIECEWFNATIRNNCINCFKEMYGKNLNNVESPTKTGLGSMDGSELEVIYPDHELVLHNFAITRFNGGNDLILQKKSDMSYSKLLSRNTTVPEGVKPRFKDVALYPGRRAVFVTPKSCPS